MKTSLRDKPTWLFDLVYGNMEPDAIVKGFIKFYAMQGLTVDHVQQDILFRTTCLQHYINRAMERLWSALEAEVAAYDPDMDDHSYIVCKHW